MNIMKSIQKLHIILILFIFVLCCSNNEDLMISAINKYNKKYLIFINKTDFTLRVFNRKLERVASYSIGYGKNPDKKAKMHVNDDRTPEGEYHITEILSMDVSEESWGYKKLSKMNQVFFKAREGHHKYGKADVDLGRNAYGSRFFSINYPNEADQHRYNEMIKNGTIKKRNEKIPGIGYGIGIHGNTDEASIGFLCSSGCIRMYNNDVIELDKYIQIGTPVIIVKNE